jgi:hypothetical protein
MPATPFGAVAAAVSVLAKRQVRQLVYDLTCPFVPRRATQRRVAPLRLGTVWARPKAAPSFQRRLGSAVLAKAAGRRFQGTGHGRQAASSSRRRRSGDLAAEERVLTKIAQRLERSDWPAITRRQRRSPYLPKLAGQNLVPERRPSLETCGRYGDLQDQTVE